MLPSSQYVYACIRISRVNGSRVNVVPSSRKMMLILFAALLVVSSSADSTEKPAEKCPETVDETLQSSLYRSNVLYSPLHRFKVLNGKGPPPKPQRKEPQDFYALREKCLKDGELFEDPEFDAVDSSLYYNENFDNSLTYGRVSWRRPKEIVKRPTFMSWSGPSRYHVKQGSEGDCWFLSVLANVASNDAIISQNVPKDQSFTDQYCGIFHFRFWQMGHWVDVVIDDRLPTKYGDLLFAKQSDSDEFWAPLFEKAYAKLYGSYEALNGGFEYEAMEDLTGGAAVRFDLNKLLPVPDLFRLMQMSLKYQTVITAETLKHTMKEALLITSKGIPNAHAYSITNVKSIKLTKPGKNETVSLLRIRNPWGKTEWTGPWHDGAPEWDFVSHRDKEELGVKKSEDGEYWMTYNDFIDTYDGVCICMIDPDTLPAPNARDSRSHWDVNIFEGEWIRGVTAGGCKVGTLHQNPQYRVTVEEADEDDKLGTLYVGLMQESQRVLRNFLQKEEQYIPAGFVIYKSENSTSPTGRLTKEYIAEHEWFETSQMYSTWRDVAVVFKVPPGVYTIIPCTFNPDIEEGFVLRVVTTKKNSVKTL